MLQTQFEFSSKINQSNDHPQVAQRQHLLKQKEAQQIAAAAAKSHNNLVANVKTPIIVERKVAEEMCVAKSSWDPVPPLAPLSSGLMHSNIRQSSIITAAPTVNSPRIDEDSNSTNQSASSSIYGTNPTTPNCIDDTEGSFAGFEGLLIPGGSMKVHSDDELKDFNKQSPVVSNNKMLADLLERRSVDPPFNIQHTENTTKRKIDTNDVGEPSTKRVVATATETVVIDDDDSNDINSARKNTTSSSTAANLYAKLAASLLEDEDMELDDTINSNINVMQSNQLQQPLPPPQPQAIVEPAKSVITVPMQRQIIVSPNNPPQMILAPTPTNPPMGQATATIKTDSGYQTVPVILQHSNSNQMTANIQYQKQIMQPVMQQSQTQYVLATNQQGQTYLLAQQPNPPPVNQILLTQTTQQQGGTPTKTIIILQQQAPNVQGATHQTLTGTPQKMIMTTQQGQQMIVTQVPRPIQHHVIVNSHSLANATSSNVIQTAPVISTANSFINQVAGGSLPTFSAHQQQPQVVSQIQLQQTHSQLSLPPPAPQINQPIIQMQRQPNTVLVQADKKKFVTGSGGMCLLYLFYR